MLRAIFSVAMALCLLGCGPGDVPRGNVKGKVSFDNQPVAKGTILFQPIGQSGAGSASGEIVDGVYQLSGKQAPAVGTHRVEILSVRNNGKKEAGTPFPPGTMVDDIQQIIPPQYNHQSKLRSEVKPGENQLDFDLQP